MTGSDRPDAPATFGTGRGPRGSTRDRSPDPPSGTRGSLEALPYVTGIVVAVLTVLITLALSRNERRQLGESLDLAARIRAAAIETRVEMRVDALARMAARWEARGGTPRDEWEADARLLVADDPTFAAVMWVSPDREIRWTIPADAVVGGLDPVTDPRVIAALDEAAGTGAPIVSEPVPLGGETALPGIAPVRLDGLPAGFVVALFPVDALFAESATEGVDARHTVAIVHEGRPLLRHDPIEEGRRGWVAEAPVDVAGITFTVRIWPTDERIGEASTPLPFVVLGFGLLTGLLLTFAMRSNALQRARTGEVQLSNRALARQVEERHRAMRDLERTRDTLASIVDAAAEGILVVDADRKVVFWNPVAERLLGRASDVERLAGGEGLYGADGVTPLEEDEFPVERACRGETVDEVVFQARDERRPDGRWITMSARPLRERDGTPRGAVAVFRDVTERVRADAVRAETNAELARMEEALAAARDELGRSNEELEQFAYVASHDLQEPVRTVASFTELLADRYRGKLGSEADELIGFIVGGALRMQRQIRDLLAYSHLQSRGRPFGRADLDAALDSTLDRLSGLIEESGAVIERRPLPTVTGDYSQLVLVLENLVENAIKFSRGATPHPRVRIGAGWGEEEAVVWVADNGIGLDPRYADRIFKIFRRLGDEEDRESTGIGLAICRRVVERHGGRIWVESKPGEGARFVLTLRVPPPDEEEVPPRASATPARLADEAPIQSRRFRSPDRSSGAGHLPQAGPA